MCRFKAIQTSILDLFQCNPSFGTGECIFNQNLKTLIFTFAPPLEQCGVGDFFFKPPTLTACNFAAVWPTESYSTSLETSKPP